MFLLNQMLIDSVQRIEFQILYATFSSKSNRFLLIKDKRGLSPEIDLNKRGYKTGHVYA